MKNGDRLILAMLAEIYKKLDISGDIDPDFVSDAVWSGQTWLLDWKYSPLFTAANAEDSVINETCDILSMWRIIEQSYGAFTEEDKNFVSNNTTASIRNPTFEGFDLNNNDHYGVADDLINKLDRFQEFKGRYLNSHSVVSLPRYRKMYSTFEPIFKRLSISSAASLSAEQMVEIMNSR
jgi:uncharacterized protein